MKDLDDDTHDDFYAFSAQGLQNAYSFDEPEYHIGMVKEPNPLYRKSVLLVKPSPVKLFLRLLIAAVWLINGLLCKVLNLVPRHQQIVARILRQDHAFIITKAIGCSEILMAVWVVSSIKSRWCTATQIVLVATMNIIEFLLAPDLLLFGKFNIVVAAIFIAILILNEMIAKPNALSSSQH